MTFIIFLKIKRCAEMARKLRFFKDQMSKAGLSTSIKSVSRVDIDMDDLEVHAYVCCLCCFICSLIVLTILVVLTR